LHGFVDDGENVALVMEIALMSLLQYVRQFAADATTLPVDQTNYVPFRNEISPYRACSMLKQVASAMV
jgi:hypothetical protein